MNQNNDFSDLHRLKQSDTVNYFSFYDKDGNYIPYVTNVTMGPNGQFGNITFIDDDGNTKTIPNTDYDFTIEVVYVLGVGFLVPGDLVKLHILDRTMYEVKYGWHTNVSNQTLHSWYLVPVDYDIVTKEVVYRTDSDILTLYKEHLETIEVVEFRKNRSSFYIGGEPN